MKLHELQTEFLAGVRGKPNRIVNFIKPTDTLTSRERLNIYRGSVVGNLSQALAEVYPVTQRLVGDTFFAAMAERFATRYSSQSADLTDYGARLAEFMGAFPPLKDYPYLPHVARLEWAWHRVFHAEDDTPLDLQALTTLSDSDPSKIVFRLPKGSRRLRSEYPIHRIWQANQPESDDRVAIDLSEGEVRLLVWRCGYDMRIDSLSEAAWIFLQGVDEGHDFEAACNIVAQRSPQIDVTSMVQDCIHSGWIAGYQII